ncbi:hypothetical protein B2K_13265 [Paenibacillus mucilaginosus K02]|uniref:Uncharacterized protein n=1 Tax=Paenibacillus mucilaginosus K02 TaxID=997761 RepID=I0BH28_9BACL|nr:hypothetical protein B2K_13265 [Paenibacillus mucilaginosus K02]
MAICLEYELVEIRGTTAVYRFGPCGQPLDGIFVTDLSACVHGELAEDTPMSEVVRLMNDKQTQAMANRVFSKIYRHFRESHEYPAKGGYYA